MLTQRCQASVLQDRRYRPAATTPSHARRFSSSLVPRATPEESGGGGPFEGLINSLTVALKNSPINEGKKALARAQAGSYDRTAARASIDAAIASNAVVVFSWSGCPFCRRAKALLDDVGATYTAFELDTMADGRALRAELAEMTDRTSVPNIWIGGSNVGGCNDGPGVMTLHKEGRLVPMLRAAGAL